MNKRKPVSATETVRQAFRRCFVRKGDKLHAGKQQPKLGLLSFANDWSLLIDYDHKQTTFPPNIYPTNQRPDGVLWSRSTRRVVLLELTCCAEEGVTQKGGSVPRTRRKYQLERLEGRSPHP